VRNSVNRSARVDEFARKRAERRTMPDLHRMARSNPDSLGDEVHEHVFASWILTAQVTVPPDELKWRVGTAAMSPTRTGTTKARVAAPAARENRSVLI
jgi:hypothetical protein